MMKKMLALLALTLCAAILCVACTFTKPEDSNIPVLNITNTPESTSSPSDSNGQSTSPSEVASIVGKWYCESSATVMQFFSNNSIKVFLLAPGFYEYSDIYEGTYSYDGTTLSYTLTEEGTISGSCSIENDVLNFVSGYQSEAYTPVTDLPNEHPSYSFPDYEALAQKTEIPELSFTGNTISTKHRANAISSVQASYWANKEPTKLTEGTVKEGDILNIDYTGFLDGVAFSGGSATDQQVTAADGTGMIDGFCSGLIGHAVGETFDVNVTFPESYFSPELAGKAVVFTMKINCIYDMTVTDEMAVEAGYESFDAWVDETFEKLVKNDIFDLIPDLSEGDIPLEAYQFFYTYYVDYYHAYAFYYYNNNYEAFLTINGVTEAMLEEESKMLGMTYLRVAQIAQKFGLTADEELTQKITEEFLSGYMSSGYTEAEAKELLENEAKFEFRATLLYEVVTDYLFENNTFVSD